MREDNEFEKHASGTGFGEPPRPIEPGGSTAKPVSHAGPQQPEKNHATLVLVLGVLSFLFVCGPLGVAAWALGASDLKKIRNGEMSSEKIGVLKFGRTLGILATVSFLISIAFAAFLWHRGVTTFEDIVKPEPLPPKEIVFAGEWLGESGTVIKIRPDGTADFRSRHSSVIGGRAKIQGDTLTIGILGFASHWHIDSRPHLDDGHWIMKLDGELFMRRAEGHLVRSLGPLAAAL
jgi:hypothetical protein